MISEEDKKLLVEFFGILLEWKIEEDRINDLKPKKTITPKKEKQILQDEPSFLDLLFMDSLK